MPTLKDFAMKAADTATGGILGLALGGLNDKRQVNTQQKLTDMQLIANKNYSEFQQEQQKEMWDYTNYENQVKHLKNAGLNTALMYGMGGGGGATVGGGTANSGGGGTASGNSGEILGILQLRAQEAQIKLLEAQAEKTKVESENISEGGVDREKTRAGTENLRRDTQNKMLEGKIKELTGLEMGEVYNYKSAWREVEGRTHGDKLIAEGMVAQSVEELGMQTLKNRTNAEIESLLLKNAKTREETRNIIKNFDILEENLKGQQLSNIILEVEKNWATGAGMKSGTAMDFIGKLIGALMRKK